MPRPWSIFDIAGKEKEITALEKKSADPDFWNDAAGAQSDMRQLAEKKKVVQRWRELESKLADLSEMMELSAEDGALQAEVAEEVNDLASYLDGLEFELAFSGEYISSAGSAAETCLSTFS